MMEKLNDVPCHARSFSYRGYMKTVTETKRMCRFTNDKMNSISWRSGINMPGKTLKHLLVNASTGTKILQKKIVPLAFPQTNLSKTRKPGDFRKIKTIFFSTILFIVDNRKNNIYDLT